MILQGSLQDLFDALYELGVIEPLLSKDWMPVFEKRELEPKKLERALKAVRNHKGSSKSLAKTLKKFDSDVLEELAVEVAREYAEYYGRTEFH